MVMFLLILVADPQILQQGAFKYDGGILEVRQANISHKVERFSKEVVVQLHFKNLSKKTIMGLKYSISYVDYFGERLTKTKHKDQIQILPGQKGTTTWLLDEYNPHYSALAAAASEKTVKISVSLTAIAFKDGGISTALEPMENYNLSNNEPEVSTVAAEPASSECPNDPVPWLGQVGVEAPVFIKRVSPRYPEKAVKHRVQGHVVIEAVLKKDGTIDDVKCIKGLARGKYGFEDEAVKAVKKCQFLPGKVNGFPCDIKMTMKIEFAL